MAVSSHTNISLKKKVKTGVGSNHSLVEKAINMLLLSIAPVTILIVFLTKKQSVTPLPTTIKTTTNMSKIPIGIRNNNWLNIRKDSQQWQGEVLTDNAFEKFQTVEYGLRAAIKTLKTYYTNYGCKTIQTLVSRWAPPVENNSIVYINNVSKRTGINKDTVLTFDKATILKLISAMAVQEVGKAPTQIQLNTAWEML